MKTKKSITLGKIKIARLTNEQLTMVYGGDHILGPKGQQRPSKGKGQCNNDF